ncbi:MAG TPA: shikimate dehydrogenase [Usitatibacter sp.]|nr:shikimate dehydrogenase [Usitatibacter sp.]
MDRYVVIGNPVAHSLSPEIHARFAASLGERIEYSRLEVPADQFAQHVRRFFDGGGVGANITLPFKLDAFAFADRVSARARIAGAANFLARHDDGIAADNTDGAGLVIDLTRNLGLELRGARVLILGAGGAARGVLGPLLDLGTGQVVIANRTRERAVELCEAFSDAGDVTAASFRDIPPTAYALVINATSSSTKGEALHLPPQLLGPGVVAYDMAYGEAARPFVERARAAGARASDGLGMLVEQAAESYLLWRGRRPETAAVLAQFGALRP